jgi:hypothetical protein
VDLSEVSPLLPHPPASDRHAAPGSPPVPPSPSLSPSSPETIHSPPGSSPLLLVGHRCGVLPISEFSEATISIRHHACKKCYSSGRRAQKRKRRQSAVGEPDDDLKLAKKLRESAALHRRRVRKRWGDAVPEAPTLAEVQKILAHRMREGGPGMRSDVKEGPASGELVLRARDISQPMSVENHLMMTTLQSTKRECVRREVWVG